MSFGTDFLALKNSISAYATLVKNKFTTMIPASDKGALNGVAPLVNGLVPAQYLPSFVDDVLEFNDVASFPAVGESGKLYVDISSSGGFNTSPFIASGSTVTAFPTGDANLSESLNNVTGQLQYGNTGSTPYKFALLFAMAAGQSIPVRVTVTNMVSTGPNWNYIGAGSLTTFQSASSSGLTKVTNGQQYTFTISDVNPYLIFRGDYPSDILRTLDILIETQVSGSWVPLTSAVPGTGNCYRWTGSAYLQINNHVGNADVATKLSTARTISASGDASWSVTFDGSGNATAVLTLATVPIAKGGTGAVTATNARANLGLAIGTDVQAQNADLQSIANIVATSGLLKKTAAGTWSLDTNTYSISTHNHDSAYAPIAHVGAGGTAHAAVTTTVNGFMLAADKVKVDALSGTNTGDETAATIKTKLGISTLSGSNTGDQSISISGDVTASGSFGVLVATVTKLNGVALSALATGLLKNTTTSGIPSIAVAGTDYVAPGGALGTPSSGNLANCTFPTLNQNTTGNAATATTATNAAQLTGVQQLNPLLGSQSSMAMSQDGGATKGSFIARSAGTGDANLAGMTFWNDAYAIKMGVRADGYFGLGGWSRAAWSWYSDPSGNMVAAGNVSAYSDPRLKDNIVVIENALDVCNALDGVFFTWNNRSKLVASPGKRDVGLLANQVKAILPMLVTPSITDDETGEVYDTVDYAKMVPVLLQAIKDLHMKVRQLEGN